MNVKAVSSLSSRKSADALILPFFEGKKPAFSSKSLAALYNQPLKTGDFKGTSEEVLCHYPPRGKEKRLILVGLGKEKKLTKEVVRRSYAKAISLLKSKAKMINIQIPETAVLEEEELVSSTAEGVLLAGYVFDANKTQKEKPPSQFTFIGGALKKLKEIEILCKNVAFARDLIIQNADTITPTFLGKQAKELAKTYSSIKTTVLDRKEIEKQKLGLIEAVAKGSHEEPALILVEYQGDPKSKEINAIVGKGVTYDTGGLNLKPTGGMETMRDDMSGGATVLGTIRAAAALKLPVNIIGAVGSTENAIGPKSYKPGDVYKSYSGVMVEITNTDAEGRLVLADTLSYVQKKYAPKRIIDIATLTGGAIIALGEEVSALMANDDTLANELIEAGEHTYERLWRLPLYEEYKDLMKSEVADIKNSAKRKASPIQGGIFLQRFIDKGSWAHIDIAGTAFPDKRKPYQPVQATGVGVRLLVAFFQKLSS